MEELKEGIQPGETYEIPQVYIGQYQKLPTRVIIHRLTEEQTQKRWKDQAIKEKKKGIVFSERSKRLSAMNVYITNISSENVPMEDIHSLYSLRWQIEILFKIWKSFFGIDHCKGIKKRASGMPSVWAINWHPYLFTKDTEDTIKAHANIVKNSFKYGL